MRISRHQMFMEMAYVVAKRATCFRENVGCIIVKDNKVISIGYNGPPKGETHCTHHPKGKCERAIHAEANALKYLEEDYPLLYNQCDLYVTHLPCGKCVDLIIKSGIIKHVFFSVIYSDPKDAYESFDKAGIKLHRIMPSGDITSHNREEIYNDFK